MSPFSSFTSAAGARNPLGSTLDPAGNLWVGAYSVGYLREVVKDKGIDVGVGGMATFNTNPSSISSFYGGTTHAGWQFFIRLRPSRLK